MESIKSFFESFKEFIWDIVGYILPGAYCLILLSISVHSDYWLNVDSIFSNKYYPYVIVIISYLLGYAIYGLNIIIQNKIFGEKSHTKTIENKINKRISYQTTKSILQKKFQEKGIDSDLENASLRDLRSIVMGFFPEQDQKTYTFAFRADIANHAGTISLFFGILGLLSSIINYISPFNVMIVDTIHIMLYIILVFSYFPFSSMRDHFYEFSQNLPFSLLLSSEINEKK